MKADLAAVALTLSGMALATPQPYVYPYNWMTGEDVIRKLLTPPQQPYEFVERDLAHAYMNVIKDATQGKTWCFTGSILPHELNNELAGAIKAKAARKPNELLGNAARHVLEELRKRYPCKGGKP